MMRGYPQAYINDVRVTATRHGLPIADICFASMFKMVTFAYISSPTMPVPVNPSGQRRSCVSVGNHSRLILLMPTCWLTFGIRTSGTCSTTSRA